MINLKDLTIIIPVKIESQDRYFNLKTVLGYLNHHFKTNVRIIESSSDGPKIDFLKNFKNLHIDYEFQILNHGESYHRTKYLNQMINKTKTKVIANYDIDVFFQIVKAGFSGARKQLHNSLAATLRKEDSEIKKILNAAKIDIKRRAETLTIKEWGQIYAEFIRSA